MEAENLQVTNDNSLQADDIASNEMLTNETASNETTTQGSQQTESKEAPTNETESSESNTDKDSNPSNLYGDSVQEEYVNFEKVNSPLKDVFKKSRITSKEYSSFENKINELISPQAFSDAMTKYFGDQASQVVKEYRELTTDIFTEEERDKLNRLPANYKVLMVKMGAALGEKIAKINSDYGVTSQETKASPEVSPTNAEERFHMLTNRLLNGGLSSDEYIKIRNERLELANYFN